MAAAVPDGADGVDDVFRAGGRSRLVMRASPVGQPPSVRHSARVRAGRPVDRAVHAAAAEEGAVGGVDDGVDGSSVMSPSKTRIRSMASSVPRDPVRGGNPRPTVIPSSARDLGVNGPSYT